MGAQEVGPSLGNAQSSQASSSVFLSSLLQFHRSKINSCRQKTRQKKKKKPTNFFSPHDKILTLHQKFLDKNQRSFRSPNEPLKCFALVLSWGTDEKNQLIKNIVTHICT
jgi:hypothetical protein